MIAELPTRFHIGTQRAGSSYIYNLLRSHPEVTLSPSQEVHFYTRKFHLGREWYVSNFRPGAVAIDTSPKYFQRGEVVAPRIRKLAGGSSRFLLVLRNPIDYAYSHFRMHQRQGVLTGPRSDAPEDFLDYIERNPDYLDRAKYGIKLRRDWLAPFDRGSFHILIFEEFIADPQASMQGVLRFFGLPSHPLKASVSSQNRALRHRYLYRARDLITRWPTAKDALKRMPLFNSIYEGVLSTSAEKMAELDREKVASVLASDVEMLADVIERPLPWPEFAHR